MSNENLDDLCKCGSGLKYKYCCVAKKLKKRTVKVDQCCDSCGSQLEADITDDFMNLFACSDLPLKNFCKDNGFYFFGIMTLAEVMQLSEKLVRGELAKADIIEIYKANIHREHALAYIDDAATLHIAFQARSHILKDAINAHFDGKYTLSVPVLFAQIEGILRDIGGIGLKENFRSTVPANIWNQRFLFSMSDNAKYFNAFISRLYEGSKDAGEFNRNPVLHGMHVNYDSEEYSIILLASVLEIRTFLWFEKNTHDLFEKKITVE